MHARLRGDHHTRNFLPATVFVHPLALALRPPAGRLFVASPRPHSLSFRTTHLRGLATTTPALMTDAELSAPFTPFDPFADAEGDDQVVTKGIVHIRLQQRNGRKSLTTIQGLNSSLDLAKLTKAFKKEFCCNGCVVDDKELGRVIQLQGDQRNKVTSFLVEEEIAAKKMIKIHGI
eukprot:contig_9809_g2342